MASRGDPEKKICEISECTSEAVRSVSAKKLQAAGFNIDAKRGKVHICKEHYRDFKKKTKEERTLQRAGW